MATPKELPVRPSLQSLRKQAKQLARDVAAGNADAIARALAQVPQVSLPLTQRNAQLVIAREYGCPGWQDLTAEVAKRLGGDLQRAIVQARRAIHDNDVERLTQLLAEHPALLSWRGSDEDSAGGLLGIATGSYGDSFDPVAEAHFTRAACAEALIDAGAVVMPSVCDRLLQSRARGLLQMFHRRNLLPRTLPYLAALGDIDAVRTALDEVPPDLDLVSSAFMVACGFRHDAVASLLLDRAIALDPALGVRIDADVGRAAFVTAVGDAASRRDIRMGVWKAFVMEQALRTISAHAGHETSVALPARESDLLAFRQLLQREPWLLDEACVECQIEIIERAALTNGGEFITALLDFAPAILRREPVPPSQALEFALTYGRPHLLPLLTRIWPLPDDLPHAAGVGDIDRVKRWFDASGRAVLGDVEQHYPSAPYMPRGRVEEYARQWGPHSVQRVLDAALAWSLINNHLDVADFLLAHGADVNTTWSSHEPASLLHELVFHGNYASMQFLIDRGIDMTMRDYRWNATARGWALHAAKDEAMARWLEEGEQRQDRPTKAGPAGRNERRADSAER